MGVESDQLVYDYLSRVGDLAQTALPAAQRMRLVAGLRSDIERERAGSDSTAAVRRILSRLGTPDEVVEAAAARGAASVPVPRESAPRPGASPESRSVPRSAPEPPDGPAVPVGEPPRTDPGERGARREPVEPAAPAAQDWWRVPGPRSGGDVPSGVRTNEILAGWSGGLLPPEPDDESTAEGAAAGQDGEESPGTAAANRRRWWPRRSGGQAAAPRRGLRVGPLELLAALALVTGVVLGNWLALAVGWLIAYTTRGLTRIEAKFAALGVPALVVLGALGWLWGRMDGRWGQPLPQNRLGEAISADFPLAVRTAALASAAFLLWRSARRVRRR